MFSPEKHTGSAGDEISGVDGESVTEELQAVVAETYAAHPKDADWPKLDRANIVFLPQKPGSR